MHGGATYDRYGGGTVHRIQGSDKTVAGDPAHPASTYAGPRLAWTGKTAVAVPTQSTPSAEGWRRMTTRAAYAPAMPVPATRARLQYPSMTVMAANTTTAPAPAASTPYTPEPYVPSPAPRSIYDPTPPAAPALPPPPTRTLAAQPGEGPRLYSVHRDYGMQPDPIPLAPQFFGPTADLTAPETPEVGHRTKTATGTVVNTPTDAGAAP